MKVTIVSLGRSHLINLAKVLDGVPGVEVLFYTMMPTSRCRMFGYNGKVKSFLFPIGILQAFIDRLPLINPYKKSAIRFLLRKAFDKLVAVSLKKCDFLIGLNGCATRSSLVARHKYNAITICDQGSSHILQQNAVRRSYSNCVIPEDGTQFMLEHYKNVDYLMAPSYYVQKSDTDNGIPKEKILLNPYGVNLKVFQPTLNPANNNDCYDVIMVGGWWKHKGCDMLAKACIDILKVKLLHVGSIIDCELPQSPLFTHVPFVSENKLPEYYKKAKIFVICSLDEGFALVQLQAAACGLPVVYSSRTGGENLSELLDNPESCVQIDEPLSAETIALAIRKALDIAAKLPQGTRNLYGDKLNEITWEAYGRRWYEILRLLEQKV